MDFIAVYDSEGTKLVSYKYDAWGDQLTAVNGTAITYDGVDLNSEALDMG